ncbi:MAG: YerC/YecD family TrpR-related protein [Firmicutes bacterium]|nr:YerC/YecD family TrpR-related protein [Bacillota bacterium]
MNEKIKSKETDLLIEAMTHLQTKDDYYNFFEDLLTAAEFKTLAGRLNAAKLLHEGKTYIEVTAATGVSAATISRISRCLLYGADGYNTVLRKMKSTEKSEADKK